MDSSTFTLKETKTLLKSSHTSLGFQSETLFYSPTVMYTVIGLESSINQNAVHIVLFIRIKYVSLILDIYSGIFLCNVGKFVGQPNLLADQACFQTTQFYLYHFNIKCNYIII